MRTPRWLVQASLAAACATALLGATATPAPKTRVAPRPTPRPAVSSQASIAPEPTPADITTQNCDKAISLGEVTLCSDEFTFNFKTGEVQFPGEVHGRTADGTYRADRGYGNLHAEIINLVGHVVVHRDATKDKAGKPQQPVTLTSDQAHIESKAKFYRASGNVKIVQGDTSIAAPLIIDDEAKRLVTASGGVTLVKGDKTMTAPQLVLDENTHVAHLTGGVHAQEPPSRTFDSTEVFYNTQTEDFKAVGGVRMQFPSNSAVPSASASPTPAGKSSPGPSLAPASSGRSPAPSPPPSPLPSASP